MMPVGGKGYSADLSRAINILGIRVVQSPVTKFAIIQLSEHEPISDEVI